MRYKGVEIGTFEARPNRFLAHVLLGGQRLVCHIKNTSRLWELLVPGVAAAVCPAAGPARKTAWDLIAVEHAGRWVNIDSSAPNRVFAEWLPQSGLLGGVERVRPEVRYGASRFDFFIQAAGRETYAEVKGVTLVEQGVARFPGAPTLRGVKHLRELCACVDAGYGALVVFIIQRDDVQGFAPNDAMQAEFGTALREAVRHGVQAVALNCTVTPGSLEAKARVELFL